MVAQEIRTVHETLLLLASVTFAAMMSPGPDMLLIVRHAAAPGIRPALACIGGICVGILAHSALAIAGIALLLKTSDLAFTIMKIVGAGYLLYLGAVLLRAESLFHFEEKDSPSENLSTAFREGLFCNVLNPKVTIFILAVFSQIVHIDTPLTRKLFYVVVMVAEVLIVWSLFAAFVRLPFLLKLLQRFQNGLNKFAGVLLIGFGFLLAWSGSPGN